ncbi:hypothetical protein [Bacillus toyonensis]|uniref:Uncharacterized protein n=1 Tax=Bacillus toyonensis TaxID=155322 RepID=A0AB73R1G7_9BACI|nr:hypothetical protein [Bacillus toyonensis]PEI85890.1 hypothetical protein CN678_14355 [Bacillus toyonensis]
MKLPEYETFLAGDTLSDFWNLVKYFVFYGASLNMVYFACGAVALLIVGIVGAITKRRRIEDDDEDDDDDEEYEYYHYK